MEGGRLDARDEGDAFVIQCAFPRSTPLNDRLFAELMMSGMLRMARTFTGPETVARLVRFEHARPRHHGEYSRVFGGRERFGQRATEIVFDHRIVDRPQMHRDPELYDLLRAEAQRNFDRIAVPAGPATRLHQYLSSRPLRPPGAHDAERRCGRSSRYDVAE